MLSSNTRSGSDGVVCFRAVSTTRAAEIWPSERMTSISVVKSVTLPAWLLNPHGTCENVVMRVAVGNVLTTEQHLLLFLV